MHTDQIVLDVLALTAFAFGVPHLFFADGNLPAMGFDYASFMPNVVFGLQGKKSEVPPEIELLLQHGFALVGAAACACGICYFLAAHVFKTKSAKLIVAVMAFLWNLGNLVIQFAKPSGTGVDGSPAHGPIPALVIFALLPIVVFATAIDGK